MKPCKNCIHHIACVMANPDMVKKTFECEHFEDKGKIKSALEKQIPKKPIVLAKLYPESIYACPNKCGFKVRPFENFANSYCEHCGQALDWGDSE